MGAAHDYYRDLVTLASSYELPDTDGLLEDEIRSARRIILMGTGRSGDVADIMIRFLRNIGFNNSYGPGEIPYILEKNDLLLAISGSGTSFYTLETARVAKNSGSRVAAITSNDKSPLATLSDLTVTIPGSSGGHNGADYYSRQLAGFPFAVLTPLGTLFELRALLFTLSIIASLQGKGMLKTHKSLMDSIASYSPAESYYEELYRLAPKPRSLTNPLGGRTVTIGEGLSGAVARFFTTRLRHCAKEKEERMVSYWLDKGTMSVSEGDMVLTISGSGGHIPTMLSEAGKRKGAKVVAITSFEDSPLAKAADLTIYVPGRISMNLKGLRASYFPNDPLLSVFELRALFFLETFIYYLATQEGITEMDMKRVHSDFT